MAVVFPEDGLAVVDPPISVWCIGSSGDDAPPFWYVVVDGNMVSVDVDVSYNHVVGEVEEDKE